MIWIRWANILRIKQRFLLVFWCLDYCTSNSASQDTVAPRPDLWIWWTFGIFSLLWSRILQTSLTPTRHKFFVQDSLGEETACSLLPGDFRDGNNWSIGAKYQISIDIQHFQCRLHDVPWGLETGSRMYFRPCRLLCVSLANSTETHEFFPICPLIHWCLVCCQIPGWEGRRWRRPRCCPPWEHSFPRQRLSECRSCEAGWRTVEI